MTTDVLRQIWQGWQIEETLFGKSPYSEVYRAVQRSQSGESYAAMKVISVPPDYFRTDGVDQNTARTYFQGVVNDLSRMIQFMASLKDASNLVRIDDFRVMEKQGGVGWNIYIRMELLTPLNSYLYGKKMTEQEVLRLGYDLCTALETVSRWNLVHCDIKPENVFLDSRGSWKLGDFGIARRMENITGNPSFPDSLDYKAPESIKNRAYDVRSDLYSLGIVMYRLLNGNSLPFLQSEQQFFNPNERKNALERRIGGERLPAPSEASPAMADLILRACAFEPEKRFSSATEMKQAIAAVANGTYQMTGAGNLGNNVPGKGKKTKKQKKEKQEKPAKKGVWRKVLIVLLLVALLAEAAILAGPQIMDRPGKSQSDTETTAAETESSADTLESEEVQPAQTSAASTEATGTVKDKLAGFLNNLGGKETTETTVAPTEAPTETFDAEATTVDSEEIIETAETTTAAATSAEDETAYINSVLDEANTLIAEQKYEQAKTLLSNNIPKVSDNSRLQLKLDSIDKLKPAKLSDLHVIDSNYYDEYTEVLVDSFGNVYDGYSYFKYIDDDKYAIFNLDRECSVFTGSIVEPQSVGSDEQMILQIYVDDVLKYTSPQFGKTTGKIDFSVDVTGGQKLKIEPKLVSGHWGDAKCAIVNTQITKNPEVVAENVESTQNAGNNSKSSGIDKLFLVDSNDFEQKSEVFNDSFGNSYDGYFYFSHVGDSEDFALFNITENCSTFSGSIVSSQKTGSNEQMVAMIYVDDVLKYTSPTFGKSTGKIDFSVDVSGGKKLNIKVGLVSGYSSKAKCAFVNLKLS